MVTLLAVIGAITLIVFFWPIVRILLGATIALVMFAVLFLLLAMVASF